MTVAETSDELTLPPLTEDCIEWLAFAQTAQLDPRRILRAVEHCGSAANILELGLTDLEALHFPIREHAIYCRWRLRISSSSCLRGLAANSSRMRTTLIPKSPRDIRSSCRAVVARRSAVLSLPSIAVVGTRHPTPYGTGMAEMLPVVSRSAG